MQRVDDASSGLCCIASLFGKAVRDTRLSATHLSLYVAILYSWSMNKFSNPVLVTRNSLMPLAKILSVTTYHKKLNQLMEYGYIRYKPSYNAFKRSKIYLV